SRIQARSCSRAASSTRLGNPCRACGTRSIFPVRNNCCRAFFANPTLTQNRCANSSSVPSPAAQAFSNRQRRSSDIGFGIASAENLRAPSLSHPLGPPVYSKIGSALVKVFEIAPVLADADFHAQGDRERVDVFHDAANAGGEGVCF